MIDNVAIIIPTYEPTKRLTNLVDELNRYFSIIIIVNDGSSQENSLEVLNGITKKYQSNIVLTHEVNWGKGRALKTAINYVISSSKCENCVGVVTVDGDGQHTVEDILHVAEAVGDSNRIVLGVRSFEDESIPLRSKFGNNVSKYIYKWACGIDVSDTQTGLRGLPKEFWKSALSVEGERYEYETNMLVLAKEQEYIFEEIPIQTVYEDDNKSSHFNPIRDSIRIYFVVIKYCFSSIITVGIDYLCFWFVYSCLNCSILFATYCARACAAFFNFAVNKRLVFKNNGSVAAQLFKYVILVFASGSVSGLCVTLFSKLTNGYTLLIKVIVECILFLFNYYIQSRFIFVKSHCSRRRNSE